MSDVLNLFKQEMGSEDIPVRVNAIHRLKVVMTLISVEQLNQLLDYLDKLLVNQEEDEVLFAMAKELKHIYLWKNAHQKVFPILEYLANHEETVIRDEAVASINHIAKIKDDQQLIESIVNMIVKFATNDNFTNRISAIKLIQSNYQKAGEAKTKLRKIFFDLGSEEQQTPMVKRVFAQGFSNQLEKEHIQNELIPIFKKLCQDDQDQVRVICLSSLNQIVKQYEIKTHLLPLIIGATQDKSWRVRLALAKNFAESIDAFGKDNTEYSLIQIFVALLKDPEQEVKFASVTSLQNIITKISMEKLIQNILPLLPILIKDGSQVKAGVTQIMYQMIKLIPKDQIQQKILPIIKEIYNDENLDVRIGVAKCISIYVIKTGPESLFILQNQLKALNTDQKWRVRSECIQTINEIAGNYQNNDQVQKQLEPIFFNFLTDRASCIRENATKSLKVLIKSFKNEFLNQSLFPEIEKLLNNKNSYLERATGLFCLQEISEVCTQEFCKDKILPLIVQKCKDPIPNIRFIVCKIIKTISLNLPKCEINSVVQIIQELNNDQDKDVIFYSKEALEIL